jgi:hypothetical protein
MLRIEPGRPAEDGGGPPSELGWSASVQTAAMPIGAASLLCAPAHSAVRPGAGQKVGATSVKAAPANAITVEGFSLSPLCVGEGAPGERLQPRSGVLMRRRCGNVTRAMRERCTSRTFPLEGVCPKTPQTRRARRGGSGPGETVHGFPTKETLKKNN